MRTRGPSSAVSLALGCGLALALLATPAAAQQANAVPPSGYYSAKGLYHDGSFKSALQAFQLEWQSGFKIGQNRWVDSICYLVMLGECHYQLGHYPEALEQFNAAFNLYLGQRDWMTRVRFSDSIRPLQPGQIKISPWGATGRKVAYGEFPNEILVLLGDQNATAGAQQVVKQGGIFVQPTLRPVGVIEVIRSMALALRRRRELLGPAAERDAMATQLSNVFAGGVTSSGNWSRVFADVHLGLAYASQGNDNMSRPVLLQSMVAPGGFDHPLTAHVLFELGRIELQQSNFAAAANLFYESSCAAYQYSDPMLIEEALRYGHVAHTMANRPGLYPPLMAAAEYARRNDLQFLLASMLSLIAEGHALGGRADAASAAIAEVKKLTVGSSMLEGKLGARLNFAAALTAYQQGQPAVGDGHVASAMKLARHCSLWMWHLKFSDGLWRQGLLSAREAMRLYTYLLREPTSADWLTEPLEAMAATTVPHAEVYDRWMGVALERKESDKFLEIADLARRHRFFSTTPMGGRMISLQWLLEGPAEFLSQQDQLDRRDLLGRYPLYTECSQEAAAIRRHLQTLPLIAQDAHQLKTQNDGLAALSAVHARQELLLRQMAVRRLPCRSVFPPRRTLAEMQEALPKKHAVVAFYAASERMYGLVFTRESHNVWEVGTISAVQERVSRLLKQWGHLDGNRPVNLRQLEDAGWQKTAGELWRDLLQGARSEVESSSGLEELVIVPDGALWYLPFEALGAAESLGRESLIHRTRVRYVPMISLAVPLERRGRKPSENLLAAVGRLFPRDDPKVGEAAFAELRTLVPEAVALAKKPAPGPMSVYTTLVDRLVVLDDLEVATGSPYNLCPIPLSAGQPGCTLDGWWSAPLKSPDQVVLPGLHTAAEDGLRHVTPSPAAGQEIFLPVMGLLASGTRTALISRWRMGGKTCHDLMGEFVLELPHSPAAEAWQRSVLLAQESTVQVAAEPRFELPGGASAPKAAHPLFWAGYMLIDLGITPKLAEVEAAPKELFGTSKSGQPGKPLEK